MGQIIFSVVPGAESAIPRALQEFYSYREQAPSQQLTYSGDNVVLMFRPEFFGRDHLPGSIRVTVEWAGPALPTSESGGAPLRSVP